jgi:outer membrane protein assembly factor BamA
VDAPDADLRPFRPPLDLGLDAGKKEPYRTKWDIDVPSIAVGVTDDGQFLTDFVINFSDLLGDQRVAIRAYTVSSYSNIDVTYFNYKGRLDWGARVFDYRDYYVFGNGDTEQAQRFSQASVFAHYPFNRHQRVEGTIGYSQRRTNYPVQDELGFITFNEATEDYPFASLALVGDTLRYQDFGPFQGHAYRIEVGREQKSGNVGNSGANNLLVVDLRGFQRVTARSQLAARFTGIMQTGNNGTIYSLGGINQLRGFDYREFFGTNIAWLNLEYRFPLVDALVFNWANRFGIGPFRFFLYTDIGTVWFEDQLHFNCSPPGPGGVVTCDPTPVVGRATFDNRLGIYRQYDAKSGDFLRDVHMSSGVGFMVPVAGLPLTWSFSKFFDGKDFSGWHSSFYIVWNW